MEKCTKCGLPIGELAYGEVGDSVHGECLAQLLLQDAKTAYEASTHKRILQTGVYVFLSYLYFPSV